MNTEARTRVTIVTASNKEIMANKSVSPRNCFINCPLFTPAIFFKPTSLALVSERAVDKLVKLAFPSDYSRIKRAKSKKINRRRVMSLFVPIPHPCPNAKNEYRSGAEDECRTCHLPSDY